MVLTTCTAENSEPFEATFTGTYSQVITGEELKDCAEKYECRVIVNFHGDAKQFGHIWGQFSFCACGPEGEYAPTQSYFVAGEGDTLFFSCEGKVIQGKAPGHPDFVTSYWRDPFVFLGGTGRFKGAKGGGKTDDYNSSEDPNSHHHWKGKIILR